MKKLKCILLVEDNEFINIYNKKVIEKMGIAGQVIVIDDGREALDYLLGEGNYKNTNGSHPCPDLIFLDVNMPRMNGWEFIEEYLKANHKDIHPSKIVILSTAPNPDDVKKYSAVEEILCFEKKPLTKEKIHSIITRHFHK
jgi:CheY-like chemotaxis protein